MSGNKLYVGNLAYSVTEEQLEKFFSQFGSLIRESEDNREKGVVLIRDRQNDNRPKGFGFVSFEKAADAKRAIEEADGKEFEGRAMKVNEAQERSKDNRGGGGRGGYRDNRGGGRDNRGGYGGR